MAVPDADKLEAVLLHELAHVARFDLWTSFAAHVACAAYWFNPLVWMAARRMRIEGERACDDAVLRCGARASDYADQLLEVVRDTQNRWAPTVAVGHGTEVGVRMTALWRFSRLKVNRRRLTLRVAAPVALGVVVLALPIAAMRSASPIAQEDGRTATITPSDSVAVSTARQEAHDTLQVATPTQRAQDTLPRSAVARSVERARTTTNACVSRDKSLHCAKSGSIVPT